MPSANKDNRPDNTTTPTDQVAEMVAANAAHDGMEQLHEEYDNLT